MAEFGLPSELCCALGVAFAVGSAASTVVGMLLQKVGLERKNNIIFTLGVLVFTVAKPGAQIIALFFAPVSLVAPLASVTILLNVAIVPFFRSEIPSQRGVLTSALLVLGCIGTTLAGSHDTHTWSSTELLTLAKEKLAPTLALCCLTAFSTLTLISSQSKEGFMASWSQPAVAVAAAAPSISAALANVVIKIFLETISSTPSFWLLPLVGVIAFIAFLQAWSTTVGVKLFDMLKYVPVQTAEQILVTTGYSMYFFEEIPSNPLMFLASSVVIILGVLFSQAGPMDHKGYHAIGEGASEQKQMFSQANDNLLGA